MFKFGANLYYKCLSEYIYILLKKRIEQIKQSERTITYNIIIFYLICKTCDKT